MPEMLASVAEAAYELALRAIEQQEKRLAELRSRSGTLLAAASIAASVLGAQVARSGSLEPFAALAILAYVGCVLATLYVLAEHRLVLEFRGSGSWASRRTPRRRSTRRSAPPRPGWRTSTSRTGLSSSASVAGINRR